MSTKPLNLYLTVVQWSTVRLMLILKCILGLQSKTFDFKNSFAQSDIPSGVPVFIGPPRYFKNDGVNFDVVVSLKMILYSQDKAARLWYEKSLNGLLDRGFVVRKMDPCLLISKTVICVVYVYDFLFWNLSQSDIGNVMKSLK